MIRQFRSSASGVARAFTLVELLVVISIIAVLAGMLVPAIKLVRDKALQSSCSNGMRQMGLAVVAYQGDNDSWFPGSSMINGQSLMGNNSGSGLETYLGYDTLAQLQASKSVRCPAMTREWPKAKVQVAGNSGISDRYSSNRRLWWYVKSDGTLQDDGSTTPYPPITTSGTVAKLPSLMLVFCGNGGWYAQTGTGSTSYWRPNFIHSYSGRPATGTSGGAYYVYDNGLVNVIFGDGHVQALRQSVAATSSEGQLPMNGADPRSMPAWRGM